MMKVMNLNMATNKIDITYVTGQTIFDTGQETIYFFYPNGIWDEDKLTLDEAKKKYPDSKYNWILVKDEF